MPRPEKELLQRDSKRNIGEELLQAIRDVKAGRFSATQKTGSKNSRLHQKQNTMNSSS